MPDCGLATAPGLFIHLDAALNFSKFGKLFMNSDTV